MTDHRPLPECQAEQADHDQRIGRIEKWLIGNGEPGVLEKLRGLEKQQRTILYVVGLTLLATLPQAVDAIKAWLMKGQP